MLSYKDFHFVDLGALGTEVRGWRRDTFCDAIFLCTLPPLESEVLGGRLKRGAPQIDRTLKTKDVGGTFLFLIDACHNCRKLEGPGKYCCKKCQKANWKRHKPDCFKLPTYESEEWSDY